MQLERRENNHEMSISPHDALVYARYRGVSAFGGILTNSLRLLDSDMLLRLASLGGNRTVLSPPISDESEVSGSNLQPL